MPSNFTVIDCEQRTPEWHAARLGRLNSSRAAEMLSQGRLKGRGDDKKAEESSGRRNLRMQLVLERTTGKPQERHFVRTKEMNHGEDTEPEARFAYEQVTGRTLGTVGYLAHNELMIGASLDAYTDDFKGIVEIKCPLPATHWTYLETGEVPEDYMKQVVHALYVSGAEWCDWMSYDPAFPESIRAQIVRVERDEAVIKAYAAEVDKFLAEVEERYKALLAMAEGKKA